jgi:hypothetical protein
MLLEGDAILRRAVTYGNIARALVEIDETAAFMQAGENFLTVAREFSKHIKAMKQFAARHENYAQEMRDARRVIKNEMWTAIEENDAGGKTEAEAGRFNG